MTNFKIYEMFKKEKEKQKALNVMHRKVVIARKHFLHCVSRQLVDENQAIMIEDLKLSDSEWTCSSCIYSTHDRDLNAALNILKQGFKQVEERSIFKRRDTC